MACTFLLRNNVELLDISSEYSPFVGQKMSLSCTMKWPTIGVLVLQRFRIASIHTFNALLRPVAVRPGTHNNSIIKSVRAIGRGGMCS